MKWVKASERLPEFENREKNYVCRYINSKHPLEVWSWDIMNNHLSNSTLFDNFQFEWLDESPGVDSNWVKVEDGLPDLGEEYLVVWDLEDGGEPVTTVMEWDAVYKRWVDIIGERTANQIVTHWMPLPAPPQQLKKVKGGVN